MNRMIYSAQHHTLPPFFMQKLPNRLNVVTTDPAVSSQFSSPSRLAEQMMIQRVAFERAWSLDPLQFDPNRHVMEQERIERTWSLLAAHISIHEAHAVDLGCGAGALSRRLAKEGASVDAVDIAEGALQWMRTQGAEGIALKRDTLPTTSLPDHTYTLVVCTELIALLPAEAHRLCVAELSRVMHPDGLLVCSTAIDIDTTGGAAQFIELIRTEFDVVQCLYSYHALWLRIKRFLEQPLVMAEKWKNYPNRFISCLGRQLSFLLKPVQQAFRRNRLLLHALEKICRFIWDREGISHLILIARHRPLSPPSLAPTSRPKERAKRKEVWDDPVVYQSLEG